MPPARLACLPTSLVAALLSVLPARLVGWVLPLFRSGAPGLVMACFVSRPAGATAHPPAPAPLLLLPLLLCVAGS